MKKILVILALSTSTLIGNASAMEVSVLGGLNYGGVSTSGTGYSGVTIKAKGALTFGATIQFNMMPAIALEVGAFSNGNKQSKTDGGGSYDQDFRSLEIPLLVKFTGVPFVDFGGGVYYEKIPTTFNVTNGTGAVPYANGSNTVDETANDLNDFGAKLNARLKIPLAPLFHFLVDGSYKLGLKDLDKDPVDSRKTASYALLAGASIGF